MSYLTQNEIAESRDMVARVAQCAATEGHPDPDTWTYGTRRKWAAAPGWDLAWESALESHLEEGYLPGADETVITDGMILAQVQPMLSG